MPNYDVTTHGVTSYAYLCHITWYDKQCIIMMSYHMMRQAMYNHDVTSHG